jgi:hypothetical protein
MWSTQSFYWRGNTLALGDLFCMQLVFSKFIANTAGMGLDFVEMNGRWCLVRSAQ